MGQAPGGSVLRFVATMGGDGPTTSRLPLIQMREHPYMGKHYGSGFLQSEEGTPRHDPYRELAASVILQAWRDLHSEDAWHIPSRDRIDAGRFLFERQDERTRFWFTMAGVDAEQLRQSQSPVVLNARRILARLRDSSEPPRFEPSLANVGALYRRLKEHGKVQ